VELDDAIDVPSVIAWLLKMRSNAGSVRYECQNHQCLSAAMPIAGIKRSQLKTESMHRVIGP
jgi:hypothetical protein